MNDWKDSALIDVLDALIDYRGKTPNKTDFGIPLITAKIVKDGSIFHYTEFIAESDYDSWMVRGIPQKGDLVLTTEAPLGEVALLNGDKVALAQRIVTLRGKENILDTTYLKYFLQSDKGQLRLQQRATGSTVLGIKQSELRKVVISYPDYSEQKKIAAILSSFDEKIETNRKINARLEELAQALFKSWFIDFEPFGGKMPEDWKEVTLSDIGDVIGGATPSKDHPEYYTSVGNGIAWLTPKDLSQTKAKFTARGSDDITDIGYQRSSTKIMPAGSILFSSRAPIGYVSIAMNEICTNQGFKSFVPKKVGTAFAYYLLKSLTPEIENKSTGSTFKEASGALMKSLNVFMPDKETLRQFEIICDSIFNKQRDYEKESARLSELRDALLPKLMSGELMPE